MTNFWVTLTNGIAASANTNHTTFIHPGVLPGGGEQMQSQSLATAQNLQLSPEAAQAQRKARSAEATAWLTAQLKAAVAKTDAWREAVAKDPSLWQTSAQKTASTLAEANASSTTSCGFYRVFQAPDWALNITNSPHAGPTFLALNFIDYLELVDHIDVLINGEPSHLAEFTSYISAGQTNRGVGVHFDRLTNGNYEIQLATTLRLNEEIGDNSVFLALSNATKTIVVYNQVAFPDWADSIQGDTYAFKARTTNPDTDWQIDIYDTWGEYVNTGSGHTTTGEISWTWDLDDYLGFNRDDFDSDPYFFSEITFNTAGNGPTVTKAQPVAVKAYPNSGEWLIAFQNRWYADASGYPGTLQTEYEGAVDAIYGGPLLIDDMAWGHPLKFGTNVYTQAQRENTWTNLLASIGDLYIRNLYYHGHGGATSIGCDRHIITTNGLITGGALTSKNSKSQIFSWQIAARTRNNRFRFVFLDGCSTASGDLPNAFNVSKTNHTIAFYQNHPRHPRPSVFVGWNQPIGGDPSWGTASKRHEFQAFWMGNWANDFDQPGIDVAFARANAGAGWIPQVKLNGALKIYGYKQMRMRDFNRKGDWRWP